MLFIKMVERQQQIKLLGSYTMSQHENYEKWACTLPANNDSWFSDGKNDKGILEEENKDDEKWDEGNELNLMPRDGQSQQHNASMPQTRGTRRRKIRDEEEQIARLWKMCSDYSASGGKHNGCKAVSIL
jgi:hypothetical protein